MMTAPVRHFEPLRPLEVESWAHTMPSLHKALGCLSLQALYIASARQPASVSLLDRDGGEQRVYGGRPGKWGNGPKGCMPVKLGVTTVHRDAVTWTLPRDPYCEYILVYRVWTCGRDDGDDTLLLHDEVWRRWRAFSLNAGRSELRNGWIDAGPKFRPHQAAEEVVLGAAKDLKIWAKLEVDLRGFLIEGMRRSGVQDLTDEPGWVRFRSAARGMMAAEVAGRSAQPREAEPARLDPDASPKARGYQARRLSPRDAEALAAWRAQMEGVKLSGE